MVSQSMPNWLASRTFFAMPTMNRRTPELNRVGVSWREMSWSFTSL